jgi:hypothetical protein
MMFLGKLLAVGLACWSNLFLHIASQQDPSSATGLDILTTTCTTSVPVIVTVTLPSPSEPTTSTTCTGSTSSQVVVTASHSHRTTAITNSDGSTISPVFVTASHSFFTTVLSGTTWTLETFPTATNQPNSGSSITNQLTDGSTVPQGTISEGSTDQTTATPTTNPNGGTSSPASTVSIEPTEQISGSSVTMQTVSSGTISTGATSQPTGSSTANPGDSTVPSGSVPAAISSSLSLPSITPITLITSTMSQTSNGMTSIIISTLTSVYRPTPRRRRRYYHRAGPLNLLRHPRPHRQGVYLVRVDRAVSRASAGGSTWGWCRDSTPLQTAIRPRIACKESSRHLREHDVNSASELGLCDP